MALKGMERAEELEADRAVGMTFCAPLFFDALTTTSTKN